MSSSEENSVHVYHSSSIQGSTEEYNPETYAQDRMDELHRVMTKDSNVLERLSTYTKELQRRTTRDSPLEVSENDHALKVVLQNFVRGAEEEGLHLRNSGVIFKDVVTKGIHASSSLQPTVANFFSDPFISAKHLLFREKPKLRSILKGTTGFATPGEMVLVLGRPGSGCSTLLKTLGGEISSFVSVDGEIHYDGIDQEMMMKKYKGDVIYNPELDIHFPHLTVDKTLKFAIGCKTPDKRVGDQTRKEYIENMRDVLATTFGLTHTYNTKVGNDFVRGVSGGERKRVSIAEAMAARGTVYCWDNATRGLDSSTALEFAQAVRISTNLLNSVAFVTIYQASQNIYETFDKVTVLYDGYQIYFGPITEAKEYFINMGFECPPRQASSEFLTSVTDPEGRTIRPGYEFKAPRTAKEFYDYWINSNNYKKLINEMDVYSRNIDQKRTLEIYENSQAQEQGKRQRNGSKFTVNLQTQLKLCIGRGFDRIYGDKAYVITQISCSIIQAFISGSLFYKTPLSNTGVFSLSSDIFFCSLYFTIMALAEISNSFSNRPILQKHKSYTFYHPGADALSYFLTNIPFQLVSLTAFTIIIYFLSGLTLEAGKFFLLFLFNCLSAIVMGTTFQMVGAISPTIAVANATAGIFMLALFLMSSYPIQRPNMHPWWKWISYVNPLCYSFESMLASNFHGQVIDCREGMIPSGWGYENITVANQVCPIIAGEPGNAFVSGDSFVDGSYQFKFSHVWRNFGILVGFLIFNLIVTCFFTEIRSSNKASGDRLIFKKGIVIPKEILMEEDVLDTEVNDDIESSLGGNSGGYFEIEKRIKEKEKKLVNAFEESSEKDIFMWQNLDYSIEIKGKPRKLLDNVQGFVKPGTLTALMGESGAGKTTLLNVLSQRVEMGVITGDILVNGKPLDKSFERSTGYVQQQDLHVEELTVRESLAFAARLRRPMSVPDEEKLEYVETIIDILGMGNYADAVVGLTGNGLNVEQRKKLSIGVELVAKPSLLVFLDEPTSGLDSQSSWAIIQLLRKLALAGQSILCTIHQPSATLFECFDRLLLLKKGGKTVYFGDIGEHSRELLDYFENNGARPCHPLENPAEYILEAIGAGATASVDKDWAEVWNNSQKCKNVTEAILEMREVLSKKPTSSDPALLKTFAVPYTQQFKWVLWRTFLQLWRDPLYFFSKMFLMVISGIFVGFAFWNLPGTVAGMQEALFAGFINLLLISPVLNQIQVRALASREIFEIRESKSNTYHWSTLLLSQYINEIPYQIVISTLYFFAYYFPMKTWNTPERAGYFYLTFCFMFQLFYTGLALWVVYFSPNIPSAQTIIGLFFAFLISFCGVVQPVPYMVGFWTFMYKLSPMTYFVQMMGDTFLSGRDVKCAPNEFNYLEPPSGISCGDYMAKFLESNSGYISNPDSNSNCAYCRFSVGDDFLHTVGIKWNQRWRDFGFIWVYIIFNIVAMLLMYWLIRVPHKKFSLGKIMTKISSIFKKS